MDAILKISSLERGFSKDIIVDANGVFSDTLKITDGVHAISNGNDRITLFLKNGYDLNLEFKGEKFSDGISFTGNGAETNNFMENKPFLLDNTPPPSFLPNWYCTHLTLRQPTFRYTLLH